MQRNPHPRCQAIGWGFLLFLIPATQYTIGLCEMRSFPPRALRCSPWAVLPMLWDALPSQAFLTPKRKGVWKSPFAYAPLWC